MAALAVFLITLGMGQLLASIKGWRGISLVGPGRGLGIGLGGLLLVVWLLTG